MTPQLIGDPIDRTNKRETEIDVTRGQQRTVDDVLRRLVAAHGVNSDPVHRRVQCSGFNVQDAEP
jgi:hypothetical protein